MVNKFTYIYEVTIGGTLAVFSYIIGEGGILFICFLLLNVLDWLTGWLKSRINKKENSIKGWKGVLKKIGYWLMIALSFIMSVVFIEIGKVIELDLGMTTLLGWFVLSSLIVNEIRSICENFVEAGFKVPLILTKGLEVADIKLATRFFTYNPLASDISVSFISGYHHQKHLY